MGRRPLLDQLLASGQLVTPFADRTAIPRASTAWSCPAATTRGRRCGRWSAGCWREAKALLS